MEKTYKEVEKSLSKADFIEGVNEVCHIHVSNLNTKINYLKLSRMNEISKVR